MPGLRIRTFRLKREEHDFDDNNDYDDDDDKDVDEDEN